MNYFEATLRVSVILPHTGLVLDFDKSSTKVLLVEEDEEEGSKADPQPEADP